MRDKARHLPRTFTGKTVVSVERPASDATVYVAMHSRAVLDPVVRVTLMAEVGGMRVPLASAWLTFADNDRPRLAMSVSGIRADSFHVDAQASDPKIELDVAIATNDCCSPATVFVPSQLEFPPENVPEDMLFGFAEMPENVGYESEAGVGGPNTVSVPAGAYLSTYSVSAGPAGATINVGDNPVITVAPDQQFTESFSPERTIRGPIDILFDGDVLTYFVSWFRAP